MIGLRPSGGSWTEQQGEGMFTRAGDETRKPGGLEELGTTPEEL